MLRYRRPVPDYAMSNDFTVSVQMANTAADLDFLQMIIKQEERLGNMPIDSLIILSRLREEKRLSTVDLTPSVQKSEANVRSTLEKLLEAGLLEAHGTGRGRTYTLSAHFYQKTGQRAEYIRQAGFNPIQQEQMVLNYVDKNKSIKRADVMDLCHITGSQAYRLLKGLVDKGLLRKEGDRKWAFYTR